MSNLPPVRNPLATGVAMALGASAGSPAQAQDEAEREIEEVVVTDPGFSVSMCKRK